MKWIKHLNTKPDAIKFLLIEENTRKKVLNIDLGNTFLNMTPKKKKKKEIKQKKKSTNGTISHLKAFAHQKKQQHETATYRMGEKNLQVIYMTISNIYKEFIQLNNKRTIKNVQNT